MSGMNWRGGSFDRSPWHAESARAHAPVTSAKRSARAWAWGLAGEGFTGLFLHQVDVRSAGLLQQGAGGVGVELRIGGLDVDHEPVVGHLQEPLLLQQRVVPHRELVERE